MSGTRSQRAIPRDKRRPEFFGQRDVSGVIGCPIVAEFPNPRHENAVRITVEQHVKVILEDLTSARRRDFTAPVEPAQSVEDFNVDQMRDVNRLSVGEDAAANLDPSGSV